MGIIGAGIIPLCGEYYTVTEYSSSLPLPI